MKIFLLICALFTMVFFVNGQTNEDKSAKSDLSEMTYGMDVDFNNKYLWRGILYNEGLIVQPNFWISCNDFTVGLWSNVTLHDIRGMEKSNEAELSIVYTYSLLGLNIENSFMYYYYINEPGSPPTGECYIGLGCPVGEFNIFTNITFDVLEYRGAFFIEHGISFEKTLVPEISITSSVSLNWATNKFNETYVGVSKTAMNFVSGNLAFTYSPTDAFYISPHIQVNKFLDKIIIEYLGKSSSYFGLTLGVQM
jgi:hypothetical protein